jgi:hypothetical protein
METRKPMEKGRHPNHNQIDQSHSTKQIIKKLVIGKIANITHNINIKKNKMINQEKEHKLMIGITLTHRRR